VTVTDWFALPSAPLQLSVKVLVVVSGADTSLPEVALLPVQAPEAVQVLAFVEDHVSVDDSPLVTVVGLAASDTVGTGSGGGGVVDEAIFEYAPRLPAASLARTR